MATFITDGANADAVLLTVHLEYGEPAASAGDQGEPLIRDDQGEPLIRDAGGGVYAGSEGHDTFVWRLTDVAGPGQAAPVDTVTGFGVGDNSQGNDVLDLSELFIDVDPGDLLAQLDNYLQIEDAGRGNVRISVSTSGDSSQVDLKIMLVNHMLGDLGLGVGPGSFSSNILTEMIASGRLRVDQV
jgi:hypothetical protein